MEIASHQERPLISTQELLAEAVAKWDGVHPSEPILNVVRALIEDANFDEATQALKLGLKFFSKTQNLQNFVTGKIPALVFHYILKQPDVDERIAVELWTADFGAKAMRSAALIPGKLEWAIHAFIKNTKNECARRSLESGQSSS